MEEPRPGGYLFPDRSDYGISDEMFSVMLGTEIITALMMSTKLGILIDTEVEHRTDMPLDMLDEKSIAAERSTIISEGLTCAMEALFTLEQNNYELPPEWEE